MNCCPSTFSLTSPTPPPLPSKRVAVGGGDGGVVLSCVVDHILQGFNNLFLTRLRTYKIAASPQTKTPVKTTFRDRCLYSSFVHVWSPPPPPGKTKCRMYCIGGRPRYGGLVHLLCLISVSFICKSGGKRVGGGGGAFTSYSHSVLYMYSYGTYLHIFNI